MDKVYVIYYKGELYTQRGRKTAYLRKGDAKRVITADSKEIAKGGRLSSDRDGVSECEIEEKERVKKNFEIRVFVEQKEG